MSPKLTMTHCPVWAMPSKHSRQDRHCCTIPRLEMSRRAGRQGFGDVKAAFKEADHVVRERLRMQRYSGVPLETRGILASPDSISGELTIWASGQWPHTARGLTAAALGMDERRVRCILPDVGGGFGVKCDLYPEDILIPLAATRLNRPVKWIEDRREHFLSQRACPRNDIRS